MKNKIIALFLTVFVVASNLTFSVSAADAFARNVITLDTGLVLNVPSPAIDKDFIIAKYESSSLASLFVKKYAYYIYEFESLRGGGPKEGKEFLYNLYYSDKFNSHSSALSDITWTVEENCYEALEIYNNKDLEIVYSTFDYYDLESNELLYESSTNSTADTDTDPDKIVVTPARSYVNLLPSISSVTSNTTDNWAVLRFPSEPVIGSDNLPVYNSDTEWVYWLLFFSDDYEFVVNSFTDYDSYYNSYQQPYLSIEASTIYRHQLISSAFEDSSITDAVLESAAGDCSWSYKAVSNGEWQFGYSHCTPFLMSNRQALSDFLSNMLVGSSASISVGSTGPWTYEDMEYTVPSFGWKTTLYDTEIDNGTQEEDEVFWLKRIYNAVVDGFNNVIDKLTELINIGGVSKDDEILDGVLDEEEGFSLLDIIKDVFGAFLKVITGFFKLISGFFAGLIGAIDNFFDLLTNGTSELFDLFNSEHGAFNEVNSFFGFMGELWHCIPTAIQQITYFSFAAMLVFALLKMFH